MKNYRATQSILLGFRAYPRHRHGFIDMHMYTEKLINKGAKVRFASAAMCRLPRGATFRTVKALSVCAASVF